jgi:hypothetical protein
MSLAWLVAPQLATAQRRYKVTVDSIPQGATVYLEAREAGVQGQTPHTFNLKRGSYTFILEAEGYEPFSRTVEVKRKSKFTFTLTSRPPPASVMVKAAAGSQVEGSDVKVNGKTVGKVPLTLTLQAGRYLVEVVKEGHEPYSQWIDVQTSEKRTLVVNLKRKDPGLGSVLVASNITGAEVYVDGRKQDDSTPAMVANLKPGKHIVEVRAKGHLSAQQEVTVEAGKTAKVAIELKPDMQTIAASGGTLMILASHKEVEILVDGKVQGKAPVKVVGLAEGSHHVEARKAGLITAEQSITVKKGEFKTIKLTLKEKEPPRRTGGIRVISPVRGAQVLIDGTLVGKTPHLHHQVAPGPHFVTVRQKGYKEQIQTVEVKAGQITEVKAELKKAEVTADAGADAGLKKTGKPEEKGKEEKPAEPPDDTRGLFSYGAQLVPPSFFTGDVSLGFPHIFEGRLTAGFFSKGMVAMDGGVEFRTYGAVSEVGVHTRLRLLKKSLFNLALFFNLGGGGGPSHRNTFYTNFGALGSMFFKRILTFSARAFLNIYSDRHCPTSQESSELEVCTSTDLFKLGLERGDLRERFDGLRFMLSAIIEVSVHRHVNIFGIFEGAPFQGNRRAYSDPFASLMPETDPGVYGRAGVSFKY